MDFVGRYILDVRLESAAPSHLKDFEAWRCEKCGNLFVDPGDGKLTKLRLCRRGPYLSRPETCLLLISVLRVPEPESSFQVERLSLSLEATRRAVHQ